jgi:hypothetical protein
MPSPNAKLVIPVNESGLTDRGTRQALGRL